MSYLLVGGEIQATTSQEVGKLTPYAKEAAFLLSLSVEPDASNNTSSPGAVLGDQLGERQAMPCTGSGFLKRP